MYDVIKIRLNQYIFKWFHSENHCNFIFSHYEQGDKKTAKVEAKETNGQVCKSP